MLPVGLNTVFLFSATQSMKLEKKSGRRQTFIGGPSELKAKPIITYNSPRRKMIKTNKSKLTDLKVKAIVNESFLLALTMLQYIAQQPIFNLL